MKILRTALTLAALAAVPAMSQAQSIGGTHTLYGQGYTNTQAWQDLINQANALCTFGFPGVQSFYYTTNGRMQVVVGVVTCNQPGLDPGFPRNPGLID